VHNPDANLKTHVQGKQVSVCGVTSPGADLVLQSNLLCVCACACSQDLKLAMNKLWSSSLLPPFEASKLRTSQLVACFQCPFSLACAVASYGYCSCCSCNTRVEKEKEVTAIQEHKKPTSKINPRNSKPGKIWRFQH